MSDEKMREEFEAFWNAPEQEELRMSCAKGWAFEVWKASRAALVVELPATAGYEGQYDGCGSELSEDWADFQCADVTYSLARKVEVKEAIEAAGVRVKQ